MKMRLFLAATLLGVYLLVTISAQSPNTSATQITLVMPGEPLATLQRTLDDQTDHGFRLAGVSYHSSIKTLHSKGRLKMEFVTSEARKYHYRVTQTEMKSPALEQALNEGGANGFRLLRQTPIPVEFGLLRPRALFVAVLENTTDSPAHFAYRVIAYRRRPYVQHRIDQALADGFVQACSHQFGPVVYLVMEKATH
jgi:hypothetical protein